MFIPISTDAPVYHWPWVTLSLIVGNIAAFALNAAGILPGGGVDWGAWAMHFGTGLHPFEWITSHFVHFGLMHLLGNMIFLWVFGLVVEGKIGWWRYLLVYFGMGLIQASLVQAVMLASNDPRPAGGASGVIYGLMAISLVWAPKNEVSIVGFLWFGLVTRVFHFEVTILALAGFYFVLQLLIAGITGFVMSSEMLHLAGASVGLGVGLLMLHKKWVDCENWDLFAVMAGTYGSTAVSDELAYRHEAVTTQLREGTGRSSSPQSHVKIPKPKRAAKAVEQMRYSMERKKPAAALAEYRKALEFDPEHNFDPADLRSLIDLLGKAKLWGEVSPLMEQYIEDYPHDVPVRLQLAALLVEIEQRPRQGLRVLEEVPHEGLSERQELRREQIETRAQELIDEGVLELQNRRWN